MKRNIIVAKNAIKPEICNAIVDLAKPHFQESQIGFGDKGGVDHNIRRSETFWINSFVQHLEIYQPIIELVRQVNQQFYGFDLVNPEALQVTKYDEKNRGFYKPHIDGVYDDVPSGGVVRKLSMSLQLTSPEYYKGGRFQFPDDSEKFKEEDSLAQGTVIFFPSYIKHGVTPVTKGIRYSLVCWWLGPLFK
tara:strand:- start:4140 stop:4712 length:573 start_codon:yes stop_codon:yes gene_type:complete